MTYYSRDQGKKFRKKVAFEIVHRQGNSEDPTMKAMGREQTGGKRKKPGKIAEGLEDHTIFNSKISLIHFG